jgi:type I restriction-modification system DNA methylase subunit
MVDGRYLKKTYPRRTTAQDRVLQERTFYGKEKKSLAYVIAIMNMILHGIEAPNVTDEELRRGLEVSWRNQGRPLRLASGS